MRLTLNGLRIARVESDADAPEDCDLLWRVRREDRLESEPHDDGYFLRVEGEKSASGTITHHIFGHRGAVRCRFSVSPTGRDVVTAATPEVSDADLVSLFSEPVMRTILVRRGLTSLHAAALARNGRAMLLMGDKGAGKSTLSAALQRQGWELLADDLVRIDQIEGVWHGFAGHRQTKLRPDAADALGYARTLGGRWESAAGDADLDQGKVMLPPSEPSPSANPVPIAALFALSPRRGDIDRIACEAATPLETVRALVANATPDPLGTGMRPTITPKAISGLARQAKIYRLALPDRLADLAASARAVGALVDA